MELPKLSVNDLKMMIADRDISLEQYARALTELTVELAQVHAQSAELAKRADDYLRQLADLRRHAAQRPPIEHDLSDHASAEAPCDGQGSPLPGDSKEV